VTDPAALWREWWRGWTTTAAPLSGNVTQSIDAAVLRTVGDQVGFININNGGAGDPDLERRIIEQAASYGRQLGRILDVLDVLLRHVPLDSLPADDVKAVEQFTALRSDIEAIKRRAAADRIEELVAEVRALRADPEANREALDRVRAALTDG
jgi:hypothetical protein